MPLGIVLLAVSGASDDRAWLVAFELEGEARGGNASQIRGVNVDNVRPPLIIIVRAARAWLDTFSNMAEICICGGFRLNRVGDRGV